MKPTDIESLLSLSRPSIHPSAEWAVVAVSRPSLAANSYVGQLWRVGLIGSEQLERYSRGFNDSSPRFSPDGSLLAFLRSDGENPPQLQVLRSSGGEPVALTDNKLGVGGFEWAPNSQSIAYLARTPEEGRYGTVKDLPANAEAPRRIEKRKYKMNGLGYTNDRRNHAFLVQIPDLNQEPTYKTAPSVDIPSPEPVKGVPESRQLTFGDFDDGYLQFSADGKRLAFVSARHKTRDIDLVNGIYSIELSNPDQEPTVVVDPSNHFGIDGFKFAPDGTIYFVASDLGSSGQDHVAKNGALYLLDSSGSPKQLTDPENSDLADGANELKIASDGRVLALNTWFGSVSLVAISNEGKLEPRIEAGYQGSVVVQGFDEANGKIVASVASATSKGDLVLLEGNRTRVLTDFSSELRKAGIVTPEPFVVTARDGHTVHGWTLSPKGEGLHPVLLNIHGGPYTQYTGTVFDEVQVYVEAGYAVVMCNPRGASGYGQAHGRAIRHQMGTLDFTDIIDFLESALEANPSFDPNRIGVMGGSYGGYMTAWIIGHDDRFKGAIVERGFLDPVGFVGTADIGDFFGDEYLGTDPIKVAAQSPQEFVENVSTPTLILHSEQDLRCPLSQGERYYLALKRRGVEAEMLIFPGENHELSRSGQPRHRLQRFEAILEWWNRYLPVE
ncbi:MAG: S9 family peptidase [Cryobacterium sp.]|nr:S9 family peptidase [Cryobacterium sp.]